MRPLEVGVMLIIKTLNGLENLSSPFSCWNSRKPETYNDENETRRNVSRLWLGDLGGELASIAWESLIGPDGVYSSQLIDNY